MRDTHELSPIAARHRAVVARILGMVGMVITLSVYLLCELYQFPPLCSSAEGILLRVSCFFVADGVKNGLQVPPSLADGILCVLSSYSILHLAAAHRDAI